MKFLKKLKAIFTLTKPHKLYFTLQAICYFLHVGCKILEPIFTAKVVTCLTELDYAGAYVFLCLDILQVILRNVFAHGNYVFYKKNYNFQYMDMQKKFINKLMNAKLSNFNDTPKESLMSIVVSNFYKVGNFSDVIVTKIAKLVQVITSIFIVFTTNVWIGLAIMLISVVDCFILVKLNKAIANSQKNIFEAKDQINKQINEIIDNKDIIREREDSDKYKKKYLKSCEKYCKAEGRDTILNSYKSNIFYILYRVLIFIVTCILIQLLSSGMLTLTLYLIVTPYLLSCTELLNDVINFTYDVEDTTVSVNRINTILNFTEEEFIKFGDIKGNFGDKNLSLIDVKYKNTDISSPYMGAINGVDISFKYNAFNVVKGNKNSGKRIIYYLLSRKIRPDSGVVLLDNIDIYNYDKNLYLNHIFYTHTYPVFLEGSILKNLKVSTKDLDKIKDTCRELGILEYIEHLPKGFNSDINNSNIPQDILYLIGFARTILKDANMFMFYDFPNVISKDTQSKLINIMNRLKENHTIIYFTSNSDCDELADVVFTMENGKVKNLKYKN